MSSKAQVLIVNNIKLSPDASLEEAFSVARRRLSSASIKTEGLSFSIFKRSVDARNKSDVKLVYSVCVKGIENAPTARALEAISATIADEPSQLSFSYGSEKLYAPPLVVGSGPAGLFSALILAENGYKPILIERGGTVEERQKKIAVLNTFGVLDSETNIQFGAGGAGTFSDGKLVTRINDPMCSYVLDRFISFGAPKDIAYIAKPHVGTDILCGIVNSIIEKIEELGGRVMFNTKLLEIAKGKAGVGIATTNNGQIEYGALILAIGHSARDTYEKLISDGFSLEAKPFSVGMRIEHLASDIDKAMIGDFAGHPSLGHAEYNLSHNTKVRGVYTFCMCPGGEVVAAASEQGGVVTNGMSHHARDGVNSNSAVVCSIFKEDYGSTPMSAINFQRSIEQAAFVQGGGNFSAPIITVGDFLNDKLSAEPSRVQPTYRSAKAVRLASPSSYLPEIATNSIKNALLAFDKKISGFAAQDAVLTGAETRTSAPVRILRDSNTRLALGWDNVYPVGEGAGYAGGITSAAIDGIKTAISIIERFSPII